MSGRESKIRNGSKKSGGRGLSAATKAIIIALIGALGSVGAAWITAGGVARNKTSQTISESESGIGETQRRLTSAEKQLAHVVAQLTEANRTINELRTSATSLGVIVSEYAVNHPKSLSASQYTRIDFGERIRDTNGAVTTGDSWRFKAPASGLYLVSAAIHSDVKADLRAFIKTTDGRAVETAIIGDPNSAVAQIGVSHVLRLERDSALWIEVAHSMHATRVDRGHISIVFLR